MMKFKNRSSAYAYADKSDASSKKGRKTPFAVAEAYKLIRTNLLFLLAQKKGRVICISSSGVSEGKSTTSVNTAIAFSQLGGKVLLVDCDCRRSSIHKKLKIGNNDGLSNVLVGFSSIAAAVQQVNDNLDVLTAGPTPPNPSELLGSANFDEFIENAKQIYDYILIDTPPINIVSDAMVIAPKTDGLILVVREGFTPYDAIQHTIESLKFANINVLGAIMNGANSKNNKCYTYRRYGKNGDYGNYGYVGYGNNDIAIDD